MRNSEYHRRFAFWFRNVLRAVHYCLSFLNIKWLDRWLLPHASCVLIENKDGQVLAVSRRDDHTKFGLPGGKVDPGESDIQAAQRELEEETGIHVHFIALRKFFEDTDDFEYWTTCYYACLLHVPEIGNKAKGESGVVKWVDREVLTSGIFGSYNTKVFQTLDRVKAEQCVFCGSRHV